MMKLPFLFIFVAFLSAATPITCFLQPDARHAQGPSTTNLHYTDKEQHAEYSVVPERKKQHVEYAALSPGCASLKIQVGDVSLARKAWKKRRRSGSPLLVPCSILSIDAKSMIQWNIVYLIQKFGTSLNDMKQSNQVGFTANGLCLSTSDINKYYKRHLRTSLVKHAKSMGHESARSLLEDLFDAKTRKDMGVFAWSPDGEDGPLWLMVPLSRQRAHRMASQAGLLQFASPPALDTDSDEDTTDEDASDEENDAIDDNDETKRMQHTGVLRIRNKASKRPPHLFVPLSAALRVTSTDTIQNDQVYQSAVVLSLDHTGDGGNPLLILSLNPTRSQVRNRSKLKAAVKRQFAKDKRIQVLTGGDESIRKFETLKAGQGPIKAKVMYMSTRSEAVFVDCGVGRNTKDGSLVRVLGMLRFDDIAQSSLNNSKDQVNVDAMIDESEDIDITDLLTVSDDGVVSYQDPETGDVVIISDMDVGNPSDDDENHSDSMFTGLSTQERLDLLAKVVKEEQDTDEEDDYEEEMDITHLVSTEDGVMSYNDPDTGESVIISDESIDDDDSDHDEEEEDDLFKNMSPEERLEMISNIMNDREETSLGDDELSKSDSADSFQPTFIAVGDEVDVYIKSVFKQSGRFMVTLDPSIQGRKPKDIKKESEAEKKLARLAEKLGGLESIAKLQGQECEGVVQALSSTGNWCYVKPSIKDLPVGVAKLSSDDMELSKGETVRIRLDGIDKSRGQLAMTVI